MRRDTRLAYAMLVAATLFWSGNFVLGRFVHTELPPIGLSFWRWAFVALLLVPIYAPSLVRQWPAIRAQAGLMILLSATGIAGFNSLAYLALQTASAVNGGLMISVTPLLILAIAGLAGIEQITPRLAAGVTISLLGAATIILQGDIGHLWRLEIVIGDAWMFAAVTAWAVYSVALRRLTPGLAPMVLLTVLVIVGVAILAPFAAAEALWNRAMPVNALAGGTVLYVALFASIAAYWCWNGAVARIGSSRSGLFLHLMPVFITLAATTLLGEDLHAYHAAGGLLVAAGIALTVKWR